jgi:hypothetical protein
MAAPEGSSCQAAFVWKAADKLRSALAAPMQPAHEYPLWIPTCLVWTASVTTGRNDTSAGFRNAHLAVSLRSSVP